MSNYTTQPDSIYAPDQVGTVALQEIEFYQREKGVRTGYATLDKIMNPMRPGQMIPVLGNTNNFKSGLMDGICQNVADQLTDPNEIVVYCTWEDSVDTIGIKNIAAYSQLDTTALVRGDLTDREWEKLRRAAVERAKKPIWLIGHSTQQYRRRERPTILDVWKLLEYLVDVQGKKIALIALDYLQRIRPHGKGDRRVQLLDIVDIVTDMGIAFHTPSLLGTQAGRQVLDRGRGWKMPQMHDAQETSNIEQSASAFLSTYMPIKTEPKDSTIMVGNVSLTVTPNLLLLGLLKQKNGPAPELFAFNIEHKTNKLYPIDGGLQA